MPNTNKHAQPPRSPFAVGPSQVDWAPSPAPAPLLAHYGRKTIIVETSNNTPAHHYRRTELRACRDVVGFAARLNVSTRMFFTPTLCNNN